MSFNFWRHIPNVNIPTLPKPKYEVKEIPYERKTSLYTTYYTTTTTTTTTTYTTTTTTTTYTTTTTTTTTTYTTTTTTTTYTTTTYTTTTEKYPETQYHVEVGTFILNHHVYFLLILDG